MKVLSYSIVTLLAVPNVMAFSPAMKPKAFLGSKVGEVGGLSSLSMSEVEDMSLEDEVEMLTQEEIKKTKKASNLRNANGVDYAPWMGIDEEDEEKIRAIMKEKAEARRKRQEQEKDVSGALLMDSQSQELSGSGLRTKVIDGQVELEWSTNQEVNTKGYLVKRRQAKTTDFKVVASYEDWGPLLSKGADGGVYRYLDTDVTPGGWVYRVTECDNNDREYDICQCLVEIETEAEQKGAVFAAVGIGALAVAAVVGGLLLDPLDGY
mmetsp:Transcript_10556/g.16178  ORF Transcript_10556/g.16178 Transcript_10556/m.16178 type:complete len:265 (+) Transcript_10556:166-960(+)|eukprot:CAMPEP_0178916514 /NCGR_PEP_ID=MMETSP0786-20121207/12690_1 /TAXON_ID=186022 /ORGANISM="Thalassionema frauenfeldii, Strain CCMP 1798" /LENGTH=264 /DNA_ID=CAMNT_0020589875 /DNA_START=194 /DNA_END=988 /DNA_ORIENTATION=-